jgi:hypothetical protein
MAFQEVGKLFHSQDGLYFGRTEDGSVYVRWKDNETTLPEASWASVVASVSARGDNSKTWAEACDFHNGFENQS